MSKDKSQAGTGSASLSSHFLRSLGLELANQVAAEVRLGLAEAKAGLTALDRQRIAEAIEDLAMIEVSKFRAASDEQERLDREAAFPRATLASYASVVEEIAKRVAKAKAEAIAKAAGEAVLRLGLSLVGSIATQSR